MGRMGTGMIVRIAAALTLAIGMLMPLVQIQAAGAAPPTPGAAAPTPLAQTTPAEVPIATLKARIAPTDEPSTTRAEMGSAPAERVVAPRVTLPSDATRPAGLVPDAAVPASVRADHMRTLVIMRAERRDAVSVSPVAGAERQIAAGRPQSDARLAVPRVSVGSTAGQTRLSQKRRIGGSLHPLSKAQCAPVLRPRLQFGHAHLFPHVAPRAVRACNRWRAEFTPDTTDPLTYHNGWVMQQPVAYAIFWQPAGWHFESGYDGAAPNGGDASYESLIKRYFNDVGGSSFFNILNQYSSSGGTTVTNGPISYYATFGGSTVDTTSLPNNGCTPPTGSTVCLTDGQIQSEVTAVLQNTGWTPGANKEFFVFTPAGVQSCMSSGWIPFYNNECSWKPTSTADAYCAYHSWYNNGVLWTGQNIIYANMADAASVGCPSVQNGTTLAPNGDATADAEISTLAHEQFESITDPTPAFLPGQGYGWQDAQDQEIGDKCDVPNAYYGQTDSSGSNVVLNGHKYIIQRMWSNAAQSAGGGGCVIRQPRDDLADDAWGQLRSDGTDDWRASRCPNPPSASSECNPGQSVVDGYGNLWVADTANNRVLMYPFDRATSSVSGAASVVLGQYGSFTTNGCNQQAPSGSSLPAGANAYTLCGPEGIAIDNYGTLYVADTGNNRVLVYYDIAAKLPDATGYIGADLVLGQPNLTGTTANNPASANGSTCPTISANAGPASQCTLDHPEQLFVVDLGALFVADSFNNRVLKWDFPHPWTAPPGECAGDCYLPAKLSWGQNGSFTTACANQLAASCAVSTPAPSVGTLDRPSAVLVDSTGRLYISDTGNNRVLEYDNSGQTATAIWGQNGNYTTNVANNGGVSSTSLDAPTGLGIAGGDFFIADSGNNRVLAYSGLNRGAERVFGQQNNMNTNAANSGGLNAGSLSDPVSIASDGLGNEYMTDTANNRVLEYFEKGPPTTWLVTTTADGACGSGGMTLRCAITKANSDSWGDTIAFTDTNGTPIGPSSALPSVTADNVDIDGYVTSSNAASPNTALFPQPSNSVITVGLDGTSAGGADGITLAGNDDAVQGLAISHFNNGVDVTGDGGLVGGDRIGPVAQDGVSVTGSIDIVGGSVANANVIETCGHDGVNVNTYGPGTVIVNNTIGAPGAGNTASGIYANEEATIADDAVDNNGGNGIEVESDVPIVNTVTLKNNAGLPILYDAAPASLGSSYFASVTVSGNGHDAVGIGGGTVSGRLPNLGIPYRILGDIELQSGAELDLSQGSTTSNPYLNGTITIDGGATVNVAPGTLTYTGSKAAIIDSGTLTADGSSGAIGFTPDAGASNWAGVTILGGAYTLKSVTIAGAGAPLTGSGETSGAGLTLAGGTPTGALTGLTISGSSGDGIDVLDGSSTISNSTSTGGAGNGITIASGLTPTLSGDTITENKGVAIFYAGVAQDMSGLSGLSISGNGADAIAMGGGNFTGTGASHSGTWSQTTVPILPQGDIHVTAGSTLNIGPNMTFLMAKGSGIYVDAATISPAIPGGILNIGDPTNTNTATTIFGSSQTTAAPGDWVGIVYGPGSSGSIHNADIADAGGSGASLILNSNAFSGPIYDLFVLNSGGDGIDVQSGSPAVSHATIASSSGNGISVASGLSPILTNDTIKNNGGFPVYYQGVAQDMSQLSTLVTGGNGTEAIGMAGGSFTGIGSMHTGVWSGTTLPIVLQGDVHVTVGSTLDIGAGMTIEVGRGACIYVDPASSGLGGRLNIGDAANTDTATTTVTSAQPTPAAGDWVGIQFQPGSAGVINHADIAYAGASSPSCCSTNNFARTTGVLIYSASPTVENSTIEHSAGAGIELDGDGTAGLANPTLTNVALKTNSNWAVYDWVLPSTLTHISGLTAMGNVYNSADLDPALGRVAWTDAGTWQNWGIPYYISQGDLNIASGTTLSLAAGVSVGLSGHAVYVKGGQLNANGASGDPVTLTSVNGLPGSTSSPAPGDWGGIDYQPGSSGTIKYATIDYAGATMSNSGCNLVNYPYYCTQAGILIEGSNPTMSITNSSFENIDPDAGHRSLSANSIEVSGGMPTLTNDQFSYCTTCFKDSSNNPVLSTGSAVRFDYVPGGMTGKLASLTATGYGYNDVTMASGTFTATGTWPNPGIPYRLDSNLTIGAGASLTIGSGTIMQMAGRGAIYVNSGSPGGILNASGTSSAPVTLTSPNDYSGSATVAAPGDWGGIDYQPGSSGTISYTTIDYAGGQMSNSGCSLNNYPYSCTQAGILVEGVSLKITYSTLENSAGNDVEVSQSGQPTLTNDSFEAVPSGRYGVVNDGGLTVTATYDGWGDPTGPYDPTNNPNGKGAAVTAGVTYTPWLNGSYTPVPLVAKGWNALGIPTTYYTGAALLVQDIQAQNPGVTVQAVATYTNGRFQMYVPGYSSNVPFTQGQGVVVLTNAKTATTWTPAGTPITTAQPIALDAGWNMISFPVPGSLKASTICSEVNSTTQSQNLGCSEVAIYTSSGWQVYTPSTGSSDFTVLADQSVMVLDGKSGTWTPK